MTRRAQVDLIKDTLETNLPPAFVTAGLDDFELYDTGIISDADEKVLTVYVMNDTDITDSLTVKFITRCQLPEIDNGQELDYHDVIFPKIRELITAGLLEETIRVSINGDPWPAIQGRGGAFIDYDLVFSSSLDDCDD